MMGAPGEKHRGERNVRSMYSVNTLLYAPSGRPVNRVGPDSRLGGAARTARCRAAPARDSSSCPWYVGA